MKRVAISLAMVTVLAGAVPSLAHGNMCDGRIDTNCHQSHDQYGYATDRCDVYINLGEPTNDYCIGTYAAQSGPACAAEHSCAFTFGGNPLIIAVAGACASKTCPVFPPSHFAVSVLRASDHSTVSSCFGLDGCARASLVDLEPGTDLICLGNGGGRKVIACASGAV